MFVDALNLPDDHVIEADLCIVGAGAAGITIARELIDTNRRVAVLESGGFEFDPETQSLYEGTNVGLPSFDVDVNRLRYFGGTTNHWAGHSRPLEPIDFEVRPWIPNSGWPLSKEILEPYYRRAQRICELGEYRYEDLEYFADATDLPILDLQQSRLSSVVYNQSPPTRFGEVYRDELRDARNVTVYLNANLLELETDSGATHVTNALAACIRGPRFSVRARHYLLGAGGMENARLLLLSDSTNPSGLGNARDLVGRYFMDHVLLRPGVDISFSVPGVDLRLYQTLNQVAGGMMFSVLAVPEARMRQEQLANFRIHLVPLGPHYAESVGGMVSRFDGFAHGSTGSDEGYGSIALHLVLEPVPNPESRITLSEERDLFDQRRIVVDWRLTDAELANAHRALELAALEFGRMGLGRGFGKIFTNPDTWPGNLEAGKHHCGTTRMSSSPESGVVDGDCRVHGIDNLYIAGSSVFPTIGYANPTLTIVALALRLADHLKEKAS